MWLYGEGALRQVWFLWLRRAWESYGHLPEIGGISLQRQHLITTSGHIRTHTPAHMHRHTDPPRAGGGRREEEEGGEGRREEGGGRRWEKGGEGRGGAGELFNQRPEEASQLAVARRRGF